MSAGSGAAYGGECASLANGGIATAGDDAL
jgi:hypothetical protein